ncbi:hypothetical protein HMY34_19670 [Thiothrix subterranea]|uniref:hypothetical protein n=1 Tax=Thiothrix subterranea TaxID=2735563 RepID=UPI00192C737D|nr:hypothetical protein [Thiothrix subterranea]QQZ30793.1 hypothetical protein HMY34_19670 [Thiothrix subterranea]
MVGNTQEKYPALAPSPTPKTSPLRPEKPSRTLNAARYWYEALALPLQKNPVTKNTKSKYPLTLFKPPNKNTRTRSIKSSSNKLKHYNEFTINSYKIYTKQKTLKPTFKKEIKQLTLK